MLLDTSTYNNKNRFFIRKYKNSENITSKHIKDVVIIEKRDNFNTQWLQEYKFNSPAWREERWSRRRGRGRSPPGTGRSPGRWCPVLAGRPSRNAAGMTSLPGSRSAAEQETFRLIKSNSGADHSLIRIGYFSFRIRRLMTITNIILNKNTQSKSSKKESGDSNFARIGPPFHMIRACTPCTSRNTPSILRITTFFLPQEFLLEAPFLHS